MALEDTQFQILRQLEKMSGSSTSLLGKGLDKLSGAADDAAGAATKLPGPLGKMASIVKMAGDKLSFFGGVAETFGRTIRGFDSNIKDSSYGLGQLANAARTSNNTIIKIFGSLAGFSETSVKQLEEQFTVYRRLTDIGGVVSSEFSTMRSRAAMLGVTIEDYARISETFANNLRLGGDSVRTSMRQLTNTTYSTIKENQEVAAQFNRLGIGASNYAEHVLKTTTLLGGFNRVFSESNGNQDVFNRKILDLTRTSTGLANAFGFSREKVLQAANEAMQDASMAQLFEDLEVEGKEEVRQLLTGMFGKEGTRVAYGLLSGQMDELGGLFASLGGGLSQSLVEFSKIYGQTKDIDKALSQSGLGQALANSKDQLKALAVATLDSTGAEKAVVNALLALARVAGNETQLRDKVLSTLNQTNTESDNQLDTLGALQREQIQLAVNFAITNELLNKFGLTTGYALQVILKAMAETSKIGAETVDGLLEQIDALQKMGQGTDAFKQMMDSLVSSGKSSVDAIMSNIKGQRPGAAPRAGMPVQGAERVVSVQGRTVPISQLDAAGMEATRGGPTPPFMKQFIAQMAEIEKFNITGIRDTHKRDTVSHLQGRAIDFTIPGGQQDAERVLDRVREIMKGAGLQENVHYKLVNEYVLQTKNQTGKHLHVEFTPKGAELFDQYRQDLTSGTRESTKPPAPPATPPKDKTSQSSTATVDTSVAMNAANSNAMMAQNTLNTMPNYVTKDDFDTFATNFITTFGSKADEIKTELSRDMANIDSNLRQILAG
jgi:hypothetical protein